MRVEPTGIPSEAGACASSPSHPAAQNSQPELELPETRGCHPASIASIVSSQVTLHCIGIYVCLVALLSTPAAVVDEPQTRVTVPTKRRFLLYIAAVPFFPKHILLLLFPPLFLGPVVFILAIPVSREAEAVV
ncbi:hypothetical protein CGRA01v4_01355 [Colletotrichum graminicola]|nr:hypothetical protein CGRA01v4_01355 [Colletotrichum graminicola]